MNIVIIFLYMLCTTTPLYLFSSQASKAELAQLKKTSLTHEGIQLLPADHKELQALVEKYKGGIAVKGIPNISEIYLTKKSLKHVFGIKIKKNDDPAGDAYLTGFHHDYNLLSEQQKHPFYFSAHNNNGVLEGFIAFNKTEMPVYKTFFSTRLTREQVIEQLIESLHNIKKYEDQPPFNMLIEGETTSGIIIRTIIDKKTGKIVTFFPVSQSTKEEIAVKEENIKRLFEKFFRNRENKPTRAPITDKEIDELLQEFPQDIPFDKALAKIDLHSPAMHKVWAEHVPVALPSTFGLALIDEKQLPKLIKKYPGRITVEGTLKTLHLTPEALKKIFSEMDDAFPPYLSRKDILQHVMEALHAMKKIEPSEIYGKMTEHEIQTLPAFKRINGLLFVKGRTKRARRPYAFLYWIGINEKTGDIEKFFPSPSETVRGPILGCQIK